MVSRKLSASGYQIGQRLKVRGVDAISLSDPRGKSMLLVSNVFYGPSWAQVFKSLEHLAPAPSLITLGSTPAVLIEDSPTARDLIGSLFQEANNSRGKQVHLDGVGFVELERRAKPDFKLIALPVASAICIIVLGFLWGNSQQPTQSLELAPISQACIVDADDSDFQNWLLETLSTENSLDPGSEFQKTTDAGQLNIVIESTIGSAAKISGMAVCDDGRARAINHRVDTSGSGAVLELGK